MLPCPGNNFAIPYDPNLLGNNVLSTLGGHLDVHSPAILLKSGGHVHVSASGLEVVDFGFSLVDDAVESVDVGMGLPEVLVSDCHLMAYGGDEAIDDGMHGGLKVITLVHVEDGFSCAG